MSDSIEIKSVFRTYHVDFVSSFAAAIGGGMKAGDTIIIDKRVAALRADDLATLAVDDRIIHVEADETAKSYKALAPFISRLIEIGFRKNHRLIVIGGGVTQDIGGFIASVLYRGVEWIFVPTTLLAQCDSCIGSKTSINFGDYKNQIGTFFPPSCVIIDRSFLKSLGTADIRSGLGEMMHYFLIAGEQDFERLQAEYNAAFTDPEIMQGLIRRSLEIKHGYIERDEFDRHERRIFNYGHSFGHAIESLTRYAVPHGIAVSIGMDIANYFSVHLKLIPAELRLRIRALLKRNWEGITLPNLDSAAFYRCLKKDKKNVDAEIRVILTRGFGKMFVASLTDGDEVQNLLRSYFDAFNAAPDL